VPSSDHGVAQLPVRGEAAILDRHDDGLSGIERSTDLACVKVAPPGARPAAGDEAAIKEPGEAQGRNAQREAKLLGRLPFQAQMRVFAAPLHWQARARAWRFAALYAEAGGQRHGSRRRRTRARVQSSFIHVSTGVCGGQRIGSRIFPL
jgi:hypothetical protein